MRHGTFDPMNGRRHELTRLDPPVLVGESSREAPAFRLDVVRSVHMHPVLAASVAAVVFVALMLYGLARKPTYTAESLIYVEPLEVRVLTDGSSSGYDPSRYDSYLQQQVQTVERADTLEAAVGKIPAGVWGPPGEPVAAAARRLLNSLKVDRVLNSYELGIDVTASSATAAAAAANAVAAAYLEAGRKDEHARADQRLQLLTEERQRITEEIAGDKTEQATLGRSLGVANPNGASGNPYDLQSEALRSQLAAAREAHDAVAAQLASVAGQSGNGLETAANEMILTDAGLISVKQTLSQRRAVLSDQMAGLTPANPVYKQDQEEIAGIDRAIERATDEARQRAERQLQDKLRLDLGRTADVEGRLNAQLAQQTAKATGAGPKLQRAAELETDLQRLSTRFATVDDAIRGLQLETGGPGQAHLAMAARVPDSAQPSRSKLILWLALPLALLFGAGAAVAARKRDPRLYIPADMQEVLGFPPMTVLPSASEVSPEAYDEFVLRLAGGLEGAYRHGGARSFVFTPVSVGGRAVAMLPQLCKKLRQIGYRAVCVGADELMPGAAKTMESGTHEIGPVRSREGFATTKLERLLEEYDLVLVAAPPLLGSAVTEYTVRSADATILLVESARTNRGELRRAAMLLERLNPQGIGAILEDLPLQYADPVFRAAVQAADSWPMMPVKRAAEKARTGSAATAAGLQEGARQKAASQEIQLPVTANSERVNEQIAAETETPEPAYAEETAYEASAPASTQRVEPPVSEANVPSGIEHARVYPIYKTPTEKAPLSVTPAKESVETVTERLRQPIQEVRVERPSAPVPPVIAAVQPPVGALLDEEPVSISTEFRPVRFHEASAPTRHPEIKYFTEKPREGLEPELVLSHARSVLAERTITPSPVALVEEPIEASEDWGWAGSRADAIRERETDVTPAETLSDVALEPSHEFHDGHRENLTDYSSVAVDEVQIERMAEAPEIPAVLLASEADSQGGQTAPAEPIATTATETQTGAAAKATENAKPLSWFKRVFGANEEQALDSVPAPEAFGTSTEDVESAASGFAFDPLTSHTSSEPVVEAAVVGAGAETANPVNLEEVDLSEISFPEALETAPREIVRHAPPIAFEESLWVRGSHIAPADNGPKVHFFLDLSHQAAAPSVAHQVARAHEENAGTLESAVSAIPEEFVEPTDAELYEAETASSYLSKADDETPTAMDVDQVFASAEEDPPERTGAWGTETEEVEAIAEPVNEHEIEPPHAAEERWLLQEQDESREAKEGNEPRESRIDSYADALRDSPSVGIVELPARAEAHATPSLPTAIDLEAKREERSEPELIEELAPQSAARVVAPGSDREMSQVENHSIPERKAIPFVPFTTSIAPISSGHFPVRTLERVGGQRAGLARAMRQAGMDDTTAARTNEVRTPFRTASGLRKAAVRQEAVLRPHVQEAADAEHDQAGMSRRWGMLSRFERIGPVAETGDLAGVSKSGTDASK